MGLIIHDLSVEEWEKICHEYEGWKVISDNGKIKPCVGCFRCWHTDPGKCSIKDGYENMGALIHKADEVVVISKYTYGAFSGFVKNVFDRCLGYVLPHFEIVEGESHHQRRYYEDKPYTFIFYGKDLSDEDKDDARRYVRAVCANIRGHVKDVIFREKDKDDVERSTQLSDNEKVLLLNASMRGKNGNTDVFAKELTKALNCDHDILYLSRYLNDPSGLTELINDYGKIVLCAPLYVDGLPSQLIRWMEYMEEHYKGDAKKLYVLSNMGLYESKQLINLFTSVRKWCREMGFDYCGGLGISAGELLGVLVQKLPFGFWPSQDVAKGTKILAKAIDNGDKCDELYTEPCGFPRSLYVKIANDNWNNLAKKAGLDPKELYRKL